MKKMVCILTFLFSFIMCGVTCYGAEIEKDIPVNAKTEVIMEGVKEGVRVKDNEIKVEMDDGTIIKAEGEFEDTVRLMVMPIKKSMKKEWNWLQKITKRIGVNKSAYDIFFINSKGVRVDAGKGSQISVMSRDRLKDINVYFIGSNGGQSKLKSKIEEYVVKFKMVRNGYYTLVIANDNKAGFTKNDNSIKDITKTEDDRSKEDALDENSNNKQKDEADNNKQEDENGNLDKKVDGKKNTSSSKTSKSEKKGIDIAYLLLILGVFVGTVIIFIIILFKKKKDEEDSKSIE